MAPLAADRKILVKAGIGRPGRSLLAAAALAYQGGLLAVSATGYAAAASTTAGTRVIGWCTSHTDNTAGADGGLAAPVETGIILLDGDVTNPPTQSDVGRHVFVTDDHTVQTAIGGSSVIAGVLVEIDAQGRGFWVLVAPEVCNIAGGQAAVEPDNNTAAGLVVEHTFVIADAATATYNLVIKEKFQVKDVIVRKTGAGAANTVQVLNGVTAISDAIVAAVDKAVTRAGTLDPAQEVVAAGGTLAVTVTRAAGSGAVQVTVIGRKVA